MTAPDETTNPSMGPLLTLLRGINVGGHNKLAMADLREWFTSIGHQNVRSYIQTGNIVSHAPTPAGPELAHRIRAGIAHTFGFEPGVVVRTAPQWRTAIEANPFDPVADPKKLHLLSLADRPDDEAVARLDPERSPGDAFVVIGSHLYVRYGRGAADTKLALDWFERTLDTTATARNWNTVLKLAAMLEN